MAIEIKHGINLLKFTALTPANFGSQWGKVAVDSPTQVDAQYGLPYIPDSALKGILNAELELQNEQNLIKKFFGKMDEFDDTRTEFGKPAQISFGNAYLGLFPFHFEDGKKVYLVPIHNLYYFQNFSKLGLDDDHLQSLFKKLLYEDRSRLIAFSLKENFEITTAMTLEFLNEIVTQEILLKMKKFLSAIFKSYFKDETFLLIGPNTATYFWQKANEKRTQIMLNKTGVTEKGSLRKIELIPEESIFLSLATNFERSSFNVTKNIISVGAWEKSGMGWFILEKIEPTNGHISSDDTPVEINVKRNTIQEKNIIRKTHKAITECPYPENIKKKIKTIIFNFGYYQSKFGTEAAIAYELAKAKPNKETDSPEVFSHRWFLWNILNLKNTPEHKKCSYPELENKTLQLLKDSAFDDLIKLTIKTTCLWLRRFSEIELNV